MATGTAWKAPTTATFESNGTTDLLNPNNVLVDDDSRAENDAPLEKGGIGTGHTTDKYLLDGFTFSVPSGATITEVKWRQKGYATDDSVTGNSIVSLCGNVTVDGVAPNSYLSSTPLVETTNYDTWVAVSPVGDPVDPLYGRGPISVSDANSKMGLYIHLLQGGDANNGVGDGFIDAVEMQIIYTNDTVMGASISGSGSVSANLTTEISLNSSVSGTSSVSADLTTEINLKSFSLVGDNLITDEAFDEIGTTWVEDSVNNGVAVQDLWAAIFPAAKFTLGTDGQEYLTTTITAKRDQFYYGSVLFSDLSGGIADYVYQIGVAGDLTKYGSKTGEVGFITSEEIAFTATPVSGNTEEIIITIGFKNGNNSEEIWVVGPSITALHSFVSGAESDLQTEINFGSSVSGTAATSGILETEITLASSVSGSATVSGNLSLDIKLDASIAGSSSVSAELETEITFGSSVSGSAIANADLTIAGDEFNANISGNSTATAELQTEITFSGFATGSASIAGDLQDQGTITFDASATGAATATGQLTTALTLAGSAGGASAATGELETTVTLGGSVTGSSSASADVETGIYFAASVVGTSSITAQITTEIIFGISVVGSASVFSDLQTGFVYSIEGKITVQVVEDKYSVSLIESEKYGVSLTESEKYEISLNGSDKYKVAKEI